MIGLSGEIPLVSHSDVTSPFPPSGNGGYASNRDVICSHSLYLLFKIHVEGTDNKKMNPLTYLMRDHPPSQRHRASPLLLF